ncbi:MAG: hypothetical protein FWG98_14615 [Candidatus Cloacimonetes bacterium]|nr:hypothetical protein [Candidatus Cloacimonadota bacterium]
MSDYIPQNAAQFAAFSKNIHAILDKGNIYVGNAFTSSVLINEKQYFKERINVFSTWVRDIQEEFPADPTRAQTTKRNEAQMSTAVLKVATSNIWQNARGNLERWSEAKSAIIP